MVRGEQEENVMKILYISPSPPPPIPGTDGLFTEIGYLEKSFKGKNIALSPFRSIPPIFPVNLYGIQHLPFIGKLDREVDLHHVFFPHLVDFRILRSLSKPVIFSLTSGVISETLPRSAVPFHIVVSSKQEADILQTKGHELVRIIRPGIDYARIDSSPYTGPHDEFVLLFGSAPWVKSQFASKGFDLVLEAMVHLPKIRLICLWRGTLYHEWCEKVSSAGLSNRVEIIREKGDISRILSRCHAAVVLASKADLVKSYPNSLMEALVAGKPVLISRAIPMSYYVEKNGCGIVVESLATYGLISAISELQNRYSIFKSAADLVGRCDFSCRRMVEEYRRTYEELTEQEDKKSGNIKIG